MSATRVKDSCFGFNATFDRIAHIHYPLLQQQQESKIGSLLTLMYPLTNPYLLNANQNQHLKSLVVRFSCSRRPYFPSFFFLQV